MKTVELQNISPDDVQVCWDEDGVSFELMPHEIKKVEEKWANLLLEQCPRGVCKFVQESVPREPGVPEVWVANNTGNPMLPKVCVEETYDATIKDYVKREVANRLCVPHPIRLRYNPGQIIDDAAKRMWNRPARTVIFPPYTRRPLPLDVAQAWFTSTAAFTSEKAGSAMIMSRPPSDFEPRETWELDDLCLYLGMLAKDAAKGLGIKYTHEYEPPVNEAEAQQQLTEQEADRTKAWQHVFYFLTNPNQNLPTEKAFLKRKAALQETVNESLKKRKVIGK